MLAIATMISAPSSTVWVPRCWLKSVAVKPGSTVLIRMPGNAFAYWTVTMFSADLEDG